MMGVAREIGFDRFKEEGAGGQEEQRAESESLVE